MACLGVAHSTDRAPKGVHKGPDGKPSHKLGEAKKGQNNPHCGGVPAGPPLFDSMLGSARYHSIAR